MLDVVENSDAVEANAETVSRSLDIRPFEITTPTEPLTGYLTAEVYEGDEISNGIIRTDQDTTIKVHWWLQGALKRCLCGYWCVEMYAESIGPGPEFVLPHAHEDKLIPLDPCGDGHYWEDIKIPAGTIDPKHCSSPYQLVVGLTYRTPCKGKDGKFEPGPMAGFCKLGCFQFYESVK